VTKIGLKDGCIKCNREISPGEILFEIIIDVENSIMA